MEYLFEGIGNELLLVMTGYISLIIAFLVFGFLKFRPYVVLTEGLDDLWQRLSNIIMEDSSVATPHNETDISNLAENVRIYNTDCCVCLRDDHDYIVTSACGHCFCGICGINLINRTSIAMKCPLCRQECVSLFIRHTGRGITEISQSDLVTAINSYNSRMEHRSSLSHIVLNQILNVPVILRTLIDSFRFFRDYLFFHLEYHITTAMIGTVAYVFLSTDLIPDFVFGPLGFVDDIIVVLSLFLYITRYRSLNLTTDPDFS